MALMCLSAAVSLRCVEVYANFFGISVHRHFSDARLLGFLSVHSIFLVLFVHVSGLYSARWTRSFRQELWGLAKSAASTGVVIAAALFFARAHEIAFITAGVTITLGWVLMAGWRRFLYAQSIPGLTERRNVVIVGAGRLAMRLRKHLESTPELGFVVCGFVDRRHRHREEGKPACVIADQRFLGKVDDLPEIIRAHFIDEVFICVPGDRRLIREVSAYTKHLGVNLRVVPEMQAADVQYLGELQVISLNKSAIPTAGLIFKRLIDIILSAAALVVLSPAMLLTAMIVRLDSRGPVFYSALRVGRKGETFLCHKFRTMLVNADAMKEALRPNNERSGVTFKVTDDPRVTRVGRLLRKYSLDELPQFWNVLIGDLSLVGPRPHPLDDYERYTLEHRRRLEVKPGITGLWQVTARRDPSFEKNISLDVEYIRNWSLWLDCRILWKTLTVVVAGTGE
jgi:exopolysaccharide biosynthesis polyprenyl glycosylphosphotransferase